MTGQSKVTASHLRRSAIIYVRQSTLAQVREHTESTARQYALSAEACRLGWPAARVEVIDADLGLSGRSASNRAGFRELVGRVCVGEVGAIFGLEVSRLARSSADLQRLLEMCSLTDTLIVDADGIYDLSDFNDRLLLGLKGTMSEAELHVLAGRLQGAKRAAAARGDLRFPLPVGYAYDDEGAVVLDADEEIRAAVGDVFAAFGARGSAYGVVAAFHKRRFPRRAYGGVWAGEVRWGRLTHGRVLGVLSNPSYTGAYVFGRFRSRRVVTPDGTIRTVTREVPREQWAVVSQDHHPSYVGWQQFLDNQAKLSANCTHDGARPPREGVALCQGILLCGSCGRVMTVHYQDGPARYDCAHARHDHVATPACRSVRASTVDDVVVERLLAVVAPEQVALALAAADEVTERRARTTRAAELAVERARYEAERAERTFLACEPENRLVGRSLEQRWEQKLTALAEAEAGLATLKAAAAPLPPRAELEVLVSDLPRLWASPTTSDKDRKRLLRTLIADVTLLSEPAGERLRIGIHWRSGATEELLASRPDPANVSRRTPEGVIDIVACLGPDHNDEELVTS
ncbi:MAG: recombinase family protein [Chloroflexota bacterium]